MARTFIHPSPKDFTVDAILYALSDPARRKIVMNLSGTDGMSCSGACQEMSPSTISFHYKILRESGLVESKKVGVSVINTLRSEELNKRFPGLLDSILKHHK